MELGRLSKAVHECNEDAFYREWKSVKAGPDAKAQAQEALLVSMIAGGSLASHRHTDSFRRMVRALLDEADPNERTSQGEAMLYIAVKGSAPGKIHTGDTSEQGRSLSAGHTVLCKMAGVCHPELGPVWMEGVALDASDVSIRVHFTFQGTTQLTDPAGDSADGQTTCSVVRDRVPAPKALTPGLNVLLRIAYVAEEYMEIDGMLSSTKRRASHQKNHVPPYIWVESTLTAYSMKGGYDVATMDGAVHFNMPQGAIRTLKRVSASSEPVNRSLVLKGQHVRVIEKSDTVGKVRGKWDGVITGKSTGGGYGVLYTADGDYEPDVAVAELFLPDITPVEGGGGTIIIEELVARDVEINGSKALPLACYRNNLVAVRIMIEHSRRNYLGLHLVAESGKGLRVKIINKKSPCEGSLRVGDLITMVGTVELAEVGRTGHSKKTLPRPSCVAAATTTLRKVSRAVGAGSGLSTLARRLKLERDSMLTPAYKTYLQGVGEDGNATVPMRVLRDGRSIDVSISHTRYHLNHSEHYMRQSCLDLTQDEEIALLLIADGARVNISQAAQRGWERSTTASIEHITAASVHEDEIDTFINERYEGRYALEAWCAVGQIDMSRLLLKHRADPNSCSLGLGRTPLHSACCAPSYSARITLLRLLIENGAQPVGTRALVTFLATPTGVWQPSKSAVMLMRNEDLSDVESLDDLEERSTGQPADDNVWRPCVILSKARAEGFGINSDTQSNDTSLREAGRVPYCVMPLTDALYPVGTTMTASECIRGRYFEGEEVQLDDGFLGVVSPHSDLGVESPKSMLTVRIRRSDSGAVQRFMPWQLKDIPAERATLDACRILTGDAEYAGLGTYQPVALSERHNKGNCFENCSHEGAALYLMELQCEQRRKQRSTYAGTVQGSLKSYDLLGGGRECIPPYVLPPYAAAKGWLQVIEKLRSITDIPVDWNELGSDGYPAVAQAIITDRCDMLRALLDCGARADAMLGDGRHVMLLAVQCCENPVPHLRLLLESDPSLTVTDTGALAFAVKVGNLPAVEVLLEHGAAVPSRHGRLITHEWACRDGSPTKEQILILLMDKGDEPNLADMSLCGYVTAMQKLIKKDPCCLRSTSLASGNNALMNACHNEDLEIFKLVLGCISNGEGPPFLDLNASNDEGKKVLFLACEVMDETVRHEIVRLLLAQPGLIVKRTEALPKAASLGLTDVVRQIVAVPKHCNGNEVHNEKTAIEHSLTHARGHLVAPLLCTLSDLEVCLADLAYSGQGLFSALEVAVHHQKEFDVDEVDDDFGRTALAWVCSHKHDSAVLRAEDSVAILFKCEPTKPFWADLGDCSDVRETRCSTLSTEANISFHINSTNQVFETPTATVIRKDTCGEDVVLLPGMSVLCRMDREHYPSDVDPPHAEGWFAEGVIRKVVSDEAFMVRMQDCEKDVEVSREALCVLRNKSKSVADVLLRKGADINAVDAVGKSVLQLTIEYGNIGMAHYLIRRGAAINGGATYAASHRGDVSLLKVLLKETTVLENWLGKYPGSVAKTLPIAQTIVSEVLALNLSEKDLPTDAIPSVSECAQQGWMELAQELLERYPNLIKQKARRRGVSAVEAACINGHLSILQTLAAAGAKLSVTNDLGEGLLFIACRSGHLACAEFLVKQPEITIVGGRALPVASSCKHYNIVEVLVQHSTREELCAAALEEFFSKDVFRAAQTEEGALSIIRLLPYCVTDLHLLHFASRAWKSAAAEALKCLVKNSFTAEGLWKVCDEVTRGLATWAPLKLVSETEEGQPLHLMKCVIVDHESKSQSHAVVTSRCEGELTAGGAAELIVEDSQVGRREVFACQIYTVVGSEADEERRDALWDILKKVLLFSTTALGCSPELLLREIGTSNPMQNLYTAMRVVCRKGLSYFFDAVSTAGLSFALNKVFESLQLALIQELCLPEGHRTLTEARVVEDQARLKLFRHLSQAVYTNGTKAETPLSMACQSGWEAAVRVLMHSRAPAFSMLREEAGSIELVCERVRDIMLSIPPTDQSLVSHRPVLVMTRILDILIEQRCRIPPSDINLLCLMNAYKDSVGREFEEEETTSKGVVSRRLDPEQQATTSELTSARWNMDVVRDHVSEVGNETKVVCYNQTMKLGILHIAALQGCEEGLQKVLDSTACKGSYEVDNEESGCLPRDYAKSTTCHNMLLDAERKEGRLPAISDIDLVLCVEDKVKEFDLTLMIRQFFFGCCSSGSDEENCGEPDNKHTEEHSDILLRNPRKQKLSKHEILTEIQALGVGAFLWEPYHDCSYIICNASLHRLEVECRRSLIGFANCTGDELPEFTSATRQAVVEHILNSRSGDMVRWRCQCGYVQNEEAGLVCNSCGSSPSDAIVSELWLDDLKASKSIQKTFGVHDVIEREQLWKLWRYQPFSSILEYLSEPSYDPCDDVVGQEKLYRHAEAMEGYFGSKISFYFLFVCFYSAFLLPLILSGIFFTIFQAVSGVDNSVTLVNGVVVIAWASIFTQRWRRKSSEFAYIFGTRDHENLSIPSSVFMMNSEKRPTWIHPVSGMLEPKFGYWERLPRRILTGVLTLSMICCVAGVMYANFKLRNYLDPDGTSYGWQILAGIENAVSVVIIDALYLHIVERMCDWENHRTNDDRQASLTMKAFIFQFVNGFSGLILTTMTGLFFLHVFPFATLTTNRHTHRALDATLCVDVHPERKVACAGEVDDSVSFSGSQPTDHLKGSEVGWVGSPRRAQEA